MSAAAAAPASSEEAPFSFDVHTHILPKTWPNWKEKFGYGGFIKLDHDTKEDDTANMMRDDGHFFRKIKDNCWYVCKFSDSLDDQQQFLCVQGR